MADLDELAIDVVLTTTATTIINSDKTEAIFPGNLVFTNSSTSTARTVTVWRLRSSTSAGSTNYLVKKKIQPEKTWICKEALGQAIKNGSRIQASQDVGSDVVVISNATAS